MEQRKKSDLPEKPKTPQQLWYNHEKKAYMKLHPEVSQKELKEALRRQWSQLPDKRRLKWISKALELQKDYEVKELDRYSPSRCPLVLGSRWRGRGQRRFRRTAVCPESDGWTLCCRTV
ncbi:hypothetical protein AMECASPLE_023973 [Ameca splendens]|uniref:HMG box domain-containing protein n=1 Tax=Ameca splendens TaxID=208324 RepID=A0ABV0Z2L9_9TELE